MTQEVTWHRATGTGADLRGDRIGDAAVTCGVVALVFVFVPVIGDLITPPATAPAILLALASLIREPRPLGPLEQGLTGGLPGAVAALISLMVVSSATGSLGQNRPRCRRLPSSIRGDNWQARLPAT